MESPGDLERLRAEFETWRRRSRRRPFPKRMWQEAYALLRQYPTARVCRELGLNATRLKEKGAALSSSPSGAHQDAFFELPSVMTLPTGASAGPEHAGGGRVSIEGTVSVTLVVDGGDWRIEVKGRAGQ